MELAVSSMYGELERFMTNAHTVKRVLPFSFERRADIAAGQYSCKHSVWGLMSTEVHVYKDTVRG